MAWWVAVSSSSARSRRSGRASMSPSAMRLAVGADDPGGEGGVVQVLHVPSTVAGSAGWPWARAGVC
jgi:hypothetical protein